MTRYFAFSAFVAVTTLALANYPAANAASVQPSRAAEAVEAAYPVEDWTAEDHPYPAEAWPAEAAYPYPSF